MAGRIRSIKPEILEDELASSLSDAAWRLWVSLWVLADDHGNVRLGARYLAANIWQDTTRDPEPHVNELIARGFITHYAVRTQRYGHLCGWSRHQRIDHPGKPRVPQPCEDDGTWNQLDSESSSDKFPRPSDSLARVSESLVNPRPWRVRARTYARDHDHDQRPTTNDRAFAGSAEPALISADVVEQTQAVSENAPASGALATQPPTETTTTRQPEREVFDYWLRGWKQIVHGARTPVLDEKRRGKIRARLREHFSVDDLKRAVDGLWASAWHIENKRYDIELVCRDASHVEQFIASAPAPSARASWPPLEAEDDDDESSYTPEQLAAIDARCRNAITELAAEPEALRVARERDAEFAEAVSQSMLNGAHKP